MSYQPFALKYRPQRFSDLVGQEHVAQTLVNSLRDDRLANAFLFTGSRGTGKTSSARILAKALNCPATVRSEPCTECDVCKAVAVGEDLDVLEIDGASNRGIEEIRRIRDNVAFKPARSRFKIYIIDEVHMLTAQAFNALLKTLEEPPSHVKFIFATTEFAQVPETIVSRCQRFDFRRITQEDLVRRLEFVAAAEGLQAAPGVFNEIARKAEGGLRDTMSLLDQIVSFAGATIALEDVDRALGAVDVELIRGLLVAVGDGDVKETLRALDDAFAAGRDAEELLEQSLEALREATAATARELPAGGGGRRALLVDDVRARFPIDRLLFALRLLLNTVREIKAGGHGRMQLEVSFLKLARSVDLAPWKDILERLERGETLGGIPGGGPTRPRPGATPPSASSAPPAQRAPWTPPSRRPASPSSSSSPEHSPSPPPQQPPPRASEPPRPAETRSAETRSALPAAHAPPPRNAPSSPTRISFDDAASAWEKVFRSLQTGNPRLAASVDGAAVQSVDGAELLVLLPAGRSFQKKTLEAPEAKTAVERMLAEALGGPVRVKYEIADKDAAPSARAPKKDVYSDPGVKKVLDAFEGGVIHVQGDGK